MGRKDAEGFHIPCKGLRVLTGHGASPKTLPAEVIRALPSEDRDRKYLYIMDHEPLQIIGRKFVEAMAPLTQSGKLGFVVVRFPPGFITKTKPRLHTRPCVTN